MYRNFVAASYGHVAMVHLCLGSCNKIPIYRLQPVIDTVQVPKLLSKYSSAGSRLPDYQVLRGSSSSVIVTWPSTIIVKRPKYEGPDKSLGLPLLVCKSLQQEGNLQKGGDKLRPTRQPLLHVPSMRITQLIPPSSGKDKTCLCNRKCKEAHYAQSQLP